MQAQSHQQQPAQSQPDYVEINYHQTQFLLDKTRIDNLQHMDWAAFSSQVLQELAYNYDAWRPEGPTATSGSRPWQRLLPGTPMNLLFAAAQRRDRHPQEVADRVPPPGVQIRRCAAQPNLNETIATAS
jgi:hypothetical protein